MKPSSASSDTYSARWRGRVVGLGAEHRADLVDALEHADHDLLVELRALGEVGAAGRTSRSGTRWRRSRWPAPTTFGVWISVKPSPSSVARKPATDAAAIVRPRARRGMAQRHRGVVEQRRQLRVQLAAGAARTAAAPPRSAITVDRRARAARRRPAPARVGDDRALDLDHRLGRERARRRSRSSASTTTTWAMPRAIAHEQRTPPAPAGAGGAASPRSRTRLADVRRQLVARASAPSRTSVSNRSRMCGREGVPRCHRTSPPLRGGLVHVAGSRASPLSAPLLHDGSGGPGAARAGIAAVRFAPCCASGPTVCAASRTPSSRPSWCSRSAARRPGCWAAGASSSAVTRGISGPMLEAAFCAGLASEGVQVTTARA